LGTGINYNSALNAALSFPISLVAGDVLVSSKTYEQFNIYGGDSNAFARWNDMVQSYGALTVLSEAPASTVFRPGLFGTARKTFTIADIDWSIFPDLVSFTESPSLATIQAFAPGLCNVEWSGASSTGPFIGAENIATGIYEYGPSTYGRDIADKWSKVALYLMQEPTAPNLAAWQQIVYNTIQAGLDTYYYFANGGDLQANGGQKVGRKFPMFLAAMALRNPSLAKDSDLLALAANETAFPEDQCTFIVGAEHVGMTVDSPRETYITADLGLAEWGQSPLTSPASNDRRSDAAYRTANWPQVAGGVLAARLMGKDVEWGHSETLLYAERHRSWLGFGDAPFTDAVWAREYDALPDLGPAIAVISFPDGVYEPNKTLTATTSSVGAVVRYTLNGDTPTGASANANGGITLTATCTLKTKTIHPDFGYQPETSTVYTIITNGTPAPPTNLTLS
jgi:hypothetical protein